MKRLTGLTTVTTDHTKVKYERYEEKGDERPGNRENICFLDRFKYLSDFQKRYVNPFHFFQAFFFLHFHGIREKNHKKASQ